MLFFDERLGLPRKSFEWSTNKGYEGHAWDGTPDPFALAAKTLAEWKWCGMESATGTGKTFFAACIVFWFLECWPRSLVVTIAPKERQLTLHIWKEINKLYPRFDRGDYHPLRLRLDPPGNDWGAFGFVAGVRASEESTTKAQGFHAEHMLIIFEETPGVPAPTLTAFQNTCVSPHNLILCLGNPDHQMDPLHAFCSLPNVVPIRVSAYDHPNVVLKDPLFISGAVTSTGIERMLARYRSSSNPLFLSRARGISPSQAEDALIRLEWLLAARDREPESGVQSVALGVDVANSDGGDKAAVAKGAGNALREVRDFQCPDANVLGSDIASMITREDINPRLVAVDGVGVGAGTVNELKRLGHMVYDLQSGGKPAPEYDPKSGVLMVEQFNNLRSQMWWQMRNDLQDGRITLPDDEELFSDLITPTWRTHNGKIQVEPKENIRKRLGRSPNKGDAAVYWNWVRASRSGVAFDSDDVTEATVSDRGGLAELMNHGREGFPRKW